MSFRGFNGSFVVVKLEAAFNFNTSTEHPSVLGGIGSYLSRVLCASSSDSSFSR